VLHLRWDTLLIQKSRKRPETEGAGRGEKDGEWIEVEDNIEGREGNNCDGNSERNCNRAHDEARAKTDENRIIGIEKHAREVANASEKNNGAEKPQSDDAGEPIVE
jgi:hypothetical protein